MPTIDVNDDVNEAVLKLTKYPFCLPDKFKRDISNEDNIAEGCPCGCVDCICLLTTEVEDDEDNYYNYNDTTDEGYYS